MKKHQSSQRIFTRIVSMVALLSFVVTPFLAFNNTGAAQITSRSLTLQGVGTDGGSLAGGDVNHLFTFTLPGGSNVGSIEFEYCTTASGVTCTMPAGLVTTAATLGAETGVTGFSIEAGDNGAPYLTRTAASVGSNVATTYRLDGITNPTGINETFFVRISTFLSEDATGSATDTGTVTASTAEPIIIDGTMPESLVFCTGATVSTTATVPDCSTATSGVIDFNQLFSPTDTATATSQMAASTNAGFGYTITANGPTLTSGGNTIDAMAAPAASTKGIPQFGLNLATNTTDTSTIAVGADPAPIPDAGDYRGQAVGDYDTPDVFKFTSGESVAASNNGSPGSTDAQIFTVSYIANVPGNQAAGTYTSTITYICTPVF
jgi:hypothetical protein